MADGEINNTINETRLNELWDKHGVYSTPHIEEGGKKKYILDAWAYPSGSGLHTGHAEGYIATDIVARYYRMKGERVLYPIGWDAFGLPAENYAIKVGIHPRVNTDNTIELFKKQVKSLGISCDWKNEIASHTTDYYRWTQWFFAFLYKRGLAYKKEALVNWDPVDQTVLANEQVLPDGSAERSGAIVEQRMMSQWFFKITDYIEDKEITEGTNAGKTRKGLLNGLDDLDWPESTKSMQRNWIGKSEGTVVYWDISDLEYPIFEQRSGLADLSIQPRERGVALIRVKETGEFVVFSKNDDPNNFVYLPGGMIENGENAYMAAVRETEEEIGVENMTLIKKIGICRNFVQYKDSIAHYVEHYFLFEISEQDFINRKEGEVDRSGHDQSGTVGMVEQNVLRNNNWEQLNWILDNLTTPSQCQIETFTTRADTLFGVTYLVLAPEHPLVDIVTTEDRHFDVLEYCDGAKKKTQLQRTDLNKEKTGVFTGGYVIHPLSGRRIPVFIADYVLYSYGTGAIMAVPAHDQRDYEFAQKMNESLKLKFSIDIPQVVRPLFETGDQFVEGKEIVERNVVIVVVKHWKKDEYLVLKWKTGQPNTFIYGGMEEGEDVITSAIREIQEETGYQNMTFIRSLGGIIEERFYAKHKDVNRIAYARPLLFQLRDGEKHVVNEDELQKHEAEWVKLEEMDSIFDLETQKFIWNQVKQPSATDMYGYSINSPGFDGLPTEEAKVGICQELERIGHGRLQTTYRMRDWLVSRQRYWGAPIPIAYTIEPRSDILDVKEYGQKHSESEVRKSVIAVVYNKQTNQYLYLYWNQFDWFGLVLGGIEEGETAEECVIRELKEETGFIDIAGVYSLDAPVLSHYYADNKKVWRTLEGQGFLIVLNSDQHEEQQLEETEKFELRWSDPDSILKGMGERNTEKNQFYHFMEILERGVSKAIALGIDTSHDKDYYNSYVLKEHLLDDSLPIILPDNVEFKPTGQSPLLDHSEFHHQATLKFGHESRMESDTMDTFVCSSWYFLRFCDPFNTESFSDNKKVSKWMPVDSYIIGAEHTVLHLLYARFFTKALFDAGLVDFDEPFLTLKHPGLILGEDNRKMSKRWGNVVNPTDIVEEFGADTLRLYEMFMGPFEQSKPWNTNTIKGVSRFIARVKKMRNLLVNSSDQPAIADKLGPQGEHNVEVALHKLIKKIGEDIENYGFNTAVSEYMKFVNTVEEIGGITYTQWRRFLRVFAPFAPYTSEVLWMEELGLDESSFSKEMSVHSQQFPEYDQSFIDQLRITLGVQVNGKVRSQIEVAPDEPEKSVKLQVLNDEKIQKYIEGKDIKSFIYIPGKIVNIVV